MINVVGELWIEITEWIVRKCSQMHNSVESFQVFFGEIAEVFTNAGKFGWRRAEIATSKKIGIKADHVVTCKLQEGSRDRTDVAFVASQKNFHTSPFCDSVDFTM